MLKLINYYVDVHDEQKLQDECERGENIKKWVFNSVMKLFNERYK